MNNAKNYKKDKKKVNGKERTCYKVKKGAKKWHRSKRYMALLNRLRELQRKQKDKRKYLHDVSTNRVLSLGNNILGEKLSYKAFQRMFGRSVARRAPGMYISMLTRKAEKAGGDSAI